MSEDFHGSKFAPEIKSRIITTSANACPMAVRLAWHASGTFDKNDNTGGSNGATMRFAPESTDGANAGLDIIQGMLKGLEGISIADCWAHAGAYAVEFAGGPKVPVTTGRVDHTDGSRCPSNGRLPDATQGAQHLRDIFYRMGFNDQEIVALSGAHTLGRCHRVRSGFDGPWTTKPLVFDNEYFINILDLEWKEVEIQETGRKQFVDVATGKLMMLPTDLALKTDSEFLVWVKAYAKDQNLFFKDFSAAFSKLIHLGTIQPTNVVVNPEQDKKDADMREAAMHGSVDVVKSLVDAGANPGAVESATGRGALHKAAYWGHIGTVNYLISTGKANPDSVDCNGDLPLHDACRFGHLEVIKVLKAATKDINKANKAGQSPLQVAQKHEMKGVAELF
jgi:catalase (peroxidase I)